MNPGTVSRILWHFTGGPRWDTEARKQAPEPKPAGEAFDNLCSILKSGKLRLGDYREIVAVVVPEVKTYDQTSSTWITKTDVRYDLQSSAVCCLSDIPIVHLGYHARRYGKFAIGFHRDSAIAAGFSPVMYTLSDMHVVRQLYAALRSLEDIDVSAITDSAGALDSAIGDLDGYGESLEDLKRDLIAHDATIQEESALIQTFQDQARRSFQDFLAYVKTFDKSEFGTIYCEREWRSTNAFKFSPDEVAMIVLPKETDGAEYFDPFCKERVLDLDLPRATPVVPWEDLIEH